MMNKWIAIGMLTMVASSWGLYTKSKITAFRVPDSSIVVDGKMDAAWKTIANESGGIESMKFSDCSRIVNLQATSIAEQNLPACLDFTPSPVGGINLLTAYDSNFVYLYFLIREIHVFDGSGVCSQTAIWKADALEIFMDPNPWTETGYLSLLGPDAEGRWFGSTKYTVQINKPISPNDNRIFLNDRTIDETFATRTIDNFIAGGSQFEVKSAINETDPNVVGVEFKIPHWGPAARWAPGGSMYFTFGYNDYLQDLASDCSGLPRAYRWAKNYKVYDGTNISDRPKGWRGKADSLHYDPSRSADGWGQLTLQSAVIEPNPIKEAPCEVNVECVSIRMVQSRVGKGISQQGTSLRLDEISEGKLDILNVDGKQHSVADIKNHVADLSALQLKPGYYFARIRGQKQAIRIMLF